MRLWIDAAPASAAIALFGMGLVERHVRAARKAGVALDLVVVDAGGEAPLPSLPADATRATLDFRREPGSAGARLRRVIAALAPGQAVLALAGDVAVDQRLLAELAKRPGNWVARDQGCAVLRLDGDAAAHIPDQAGDLAAIAEALLAGGGAGEFKQGDFHAHIANLRRDLPFWLRPVRDQQARAQAERFMFKASYKGSTDFFTKYVYPPLVWLSVRPLAAARVHPNTVTWVSVFLTLAAVPFFAWGWWIAGLLCAYGMSVLDSVDGKLARLTYTDSKFGNVLDHGLDIVHPPLWYLGWAIGLAHPGSLAPLDQPLLMAAGWALVGFYVLDRLVLMVYRLKFGRGLHAHAPIDGLVRTFIARRNIFLPLFTVGLILGVAAQAFYLIVAWQVLTVAYHAVRTGWILANGRRPATAHEQ